MVKKFYFNKPQLKSSKAIAEEVKEFAAIKARETIPKQAPKFGKIKTKPLKKLLKRTGAGNMFQDAGGQVLI